MFQMYVFVYLKRIASVQMNSIHVLKTYFYKHVTCPWKGTRQVRRQEEEYFGSQLPNPKNTQCVSEMHVFPEIDVIVHLVSVS